MVSVCGGDTVMINWRNNVTVRGAAESRVVSTLEGRSLNTKSIIQTMGEGTAPIDARSIFLDRRKKKRRLLLIYLKCLLHTCSNVGF
jgi:hypothetical protein